jgi:hypothetical protein
MCPFLNLVFTDSENYTEKAIVYNVTENIYTPTCVMHFLFAFARLFALQREPERFDNESNTKPAIKFSANHVINNSEILYDFEVLNF